MKGRFQPLKQITLITVMTTASTVAFAQTKVTGVVVDKMNEPIIGGSIIIKGTSVGTVTDYDGNFTLEVPENGKTLVFSYVGMQSKELPVKAGTMNVVLEETSQALDEVVVVGYGTQKKRDLTGSVASISSEALKDIPVTNAAEAITGRLAGVQVTTTEGSPDAEMKVRVRGGGSITGDNTPLYIVDGFPVSSISDIPPSDIQSIDVLKDASSTAIYGSQGANGVIIITTKTPKEGKLSISYNGTFGFRKLAKKLDVLSTYEYAKWQAENSIMQNNTGYDKRFNGVSNDYTKYFGNLQDLDLYQNVSGTDWQDEIFGRTGTLFNNSLNLTGGNETVNYTASYARTDDKAIMMDSNYKRDNLSFKMNAKPFKFLKLNFSTRYTDTEVKGSGMNEQNEKSSSDSRLKNAVIYSPIDLKLTETSDEEENLGGLINPILSITDNYRLKTQKNYAINGGASLDLMKGLTLRTELGIENRTTEDNRFYGTSTYYSINAATIKNSPAVTITETNEGRFRNANTINYNKKFNKVHNFSAMVGQELTRRTSHVKTSLVEGLPESFTPDQSFKMTPAGQFAATNNYYGRDRVILSFFGRANYDYLGRYLVTATMRADGSSMFSQGNRWGYFPSIAGAWRLSDEQFMIGASDWLSNLKLRLSFGTAGNDGGTSDYFQAWETKTTSYVNGYNSYWTTGNALYNPDIKWETTFTRNIGLDFGFFNNRLSGSIEGYYNSTKDLLINMPIYGTGYEFQTQNVGSTRNIGVEFAVNGVIVDNRNFTLEAGFNMGHNQNKVTSLGGLDEIAANSAWTSRISDDYRVYVGQSVGLMYGYVTDGIYTTDDFKTTIDANGNLVADLDANGNWQAKDGVVNNSSLTGKSWGPGALKLKDLDGDGEITTADRKVIGNANPKLSGGFNINMRYKNFDFASNFTFMLGNKIYNANKIEFTSNDQTRYYRNMLNIMNSSNRYSRVDMNTGEMIYDINQLNSMNQDATMWIPMNTFALHSWAVEDGSFLRLNNLTVGYTLPKELIQKVKLSNVRFFFSGTNLFCLTKYSGYDPEVDTRRKTSLTPGVDYSAYPKSRSYNFGVNVTL